MNESQTIGDGYYLRRGHLPKGDDPVLNTLILMDMKPTMVVEIGCSDGWRLEGIRQKFNCKCYGVDPSGLAIINGRKDYPHICLSAGVADDLPYPDSISDVVIFGHCLYTCPQEKLFEIAAEADRVLIDGGHIIVYDFYPKVPYYNQSVDCEWTMTYKMDYSEMFSWHPYYKMVYRNILTEEGTVAEDRLILAVLRKVTM
jgi:ubiquinone/menaquinone biosynthesis C-methylase UbiE